MIKKMKKKLSILIFTDLDGSLLHRETFEFSEIKDYIKNLVSNKIYVIPNSSKTHNEILNFNKKLGEELPHISENGSTINGLNLIDKDLPKELILSREKDELEKIFENEIPENLKIKCKWLRKMDKDSQIKALGLTGISLNHAMNRKYSIPFLFEGNKSEKIEILKKLKKKRLTLQEGGRVINLCDKISKSKSMKIFVKFFKKINENVKTIAVGDNFNDLDMLKNADIPCLVFNDNFKLDQININNLLISNKPAPHGWADVVKIALDKLGYKD